MRSLTIYVLTGSMAVVCVYAGGVLFVHAQETATATSSVSASSSSGTASGTASVQTQTTTQASSNATNTQATGYGAEKQKRLTDLAANISNRIDAAVARLLDIANRIDSRANKLSSQNLNMTDVRFYLSKARESISSVQTDMSTIDSRVAATVGSEKPFTDWSNIKDTFIDSKSRLETGKRLLQQSVDQMNYRIQLEEESNNNGQNSSSSQTTATSSN